MDEVQGAGDRVNRLRTGFTLSIILGAIWAAAGLFDATPTNFIVGVLVSALAWIGYGAVDWVDR